MRRWLLPDASTRVESWYFSQKTVTVRGGGACPAVAQRKRGRTFCRHGTNFIECWRDRGTSLIGATNLSLVTKLVGGTGAVSRYNLSRSQKSITMQDLNCGQVRVYGCKIYYKFVLGAEANKNRDKLIKHTVRVSFSFYLIMLNEKYLSITASSLIMLFLQTSGFINLFLIHYNNL